MNLDRKLREGIEQHMRRERISQQELAKRLDISPQYLSDVMTGRRGNLPKSLAGILKALRLEVVVTPLGGKLTSDLEQQLEVAGPLQLHEGQGRPRGSTVRLKDGALVSDAVTAERDERERSL